MIVFLDLDDTLIHTRDTPYVGPVEYATFTTSAGVSHIRPGMDRFIKALSMLPVEVCVFSAGTYSYVHKVVNNLFPQGFVKRVYTRDDCSITHHNTTKVLPRDIDPNKVIVVDDRYDVYVDKVHTVLIPPFHTLTIEHDHSAVMINAGFTKTAGSWEFAGVTFRDIDSIYDIFACCIIANLSVAVRNLQNYLLATSSYYVPVLDHEYKFISPDTLELLEPRSIVAIENSLHRACTQLATGRLTKRTYDTLVERGTAELIIEVMNLPAHVGDYEELAALISGRSVLDNVIVGIRQHLWR